jgi:hypothetical protein
MTTHAEGAMHLPGILQHPRLVFDKLGFFETRIVCYYLRKNIPFTVVMSPNPSEKEQHNGK